MKTFANVLTLLVLALATTQSYGMGASEPNADDYRYDGHIEYQSHEMSAAAAAQTLNDEAFKKGILQPNDRIWGCDVSDTGYYGTNNQSGELEQIHVFKYSACTFADQLSTVEYTLAAPIGKSDQVRYTELANYNDLVLIKDVIIVYCQGDSYGASAFILGGKIIKVVARGDVITKSCHLNGTQFGCEKHNFQIDFSHKVEGPSSNWEGLWTFMGGAPSHNPIYYESSVTTDAAKPTIQPLFCQEQHSAP